MIKKGTQSACPFFDYVVPEARIELARTQGPLDFESSASTNFTTPAWNWVYSKLGGVVNKIESFTGLGGQDAGKL